MGFCAEIALPPAMRIKTPWRKVAVASVMIIG
jgi:hypothetical protein